MPSATALTYSAAELRAAMVATNGNVSHAALRLGTSVSNLRGHAARRGVDLQALRQEIRAHVLTAAAPVALDEPPVGGDALPSARSVIADVLIDHAAMAMQIERMAEELDDANRIIASLMRELEARAA